MRDQLGTSRYAVRGSSLQNFYEPSRRFPGKMHWDYCFVFEVSIDGEVNPKSWLASVAYVSPRETGAEFGSSQADLAARIGLL